MPKAFEIGAIFSTLFETIGNVANGNEDFDFFTDMAVHTFTQTFAIGMPALLAPVQEAYSNKSLFTGRQLESTWMQKLPAGMRSKPWTPEALKFIGEELNVSPIKLQTILRGYTATYSSIFFTLSDLAFGMRDDNVRPSMSMPEFFGLNRFVKDRPESIKQTTRFYEFADETEKLFNAIGNYQKLGRMSEARELAKKNPDFKLRKRFLDAVNQKLAVIRRQESFAWSSTTMTSEEKTEKLDMLKEKKNRIYRKAYEQIYKIKSK
jgi:hypothetical protein